MDDSSDSFSPADTSSQSQAQAQAQAIVQDQGQAQAQSSRALAPRPSEDGSGPTMSHAGAAGTPSAPKKRPAQASRGVSTMTPERLARKRANDREAQRAVRERTRAQIRGLQDEVLVLKGDQAQLQQVLQHNSALQAENEAMKTIVTQLVQQLDAHTINPHASQPHHQHQHEHHHQHQHQHQHQHHHHHHHQRLQHHQRQKMQQQQQQQQQQHNNFTPSASSSSPDTSLRESSESSLGRLSSGQSSVSNLENMNGSGCGANRNGNGGFGANSAANTVVLPGIAELTRGPFASDLSGTPGSSSFRPRDQNPSNFERLDLQFPAKNQHGQGSFAPQQLQQHYPPFNDAEPRTSSPRAFASSSRINLSELSRIAQVMPPISAFERPSPPMVHALNSIDASMITMGSAVHFTSNQSDIVNDVSTPMSSGEPSNVNGNGSSNGSSNGGSGRNGNGRSNQDNSSGSHNSFESPRTNNSSIDIDMSNNSNGNDNGNGNGNGNSNGSGSGSNGNTSNNGVKNINGKRVRSPHSGPLKSPVEILDGDGDGNNLGRSSSNSVKLQILHITSTCKIDTHLLALFSLQDVGHAMQPEIATLLAPATVSYSSLRGKLDPISATLSDIIASFETFQRLPERVAMMYASFLLVKYLVNPSPENLARVPGFMRPSEDQCQPHAAWIDLFPFPHARAKLVRDLNSTHNNQHNGSGAASPLACNGDGNSNGNSNGNGNGNGNSNGLDNGNENGDNFGRFFETYLSSFSIGWPYEDTDVLLLTPNRELIINPVFDRHIRRLENWTLGLKFRETYPEFSHLVNLRDEN